MKKGVDPEHISIVRNGADLERFHPLPERNSLTKALKLEDKFTVSYVGTHGMAHCLDTAIKAANLLKMEENILFMLVGDGAERNKLIKQRDALHLKNVLMLPQQQKEKVPELLASSDCCMVLLKKNELFKTVIPSKMFEAMAMERPVILGVEGESKEIILEGNCGICIEPENHRQLAEAVLRLYNDQNLLKRLGHDGRQYVEKNFDRENLAKMYIDILEEVRTSQNSKHFINKTPI